MEESLESSPPPNGTVTSYAETQSPLEQSADSNPASTSLTNSDQAGMADALAKVEKNSTKVEEIKQEARGFRDEGIEEELVKTEPNRTVEEPDVHHSNHSHQGSEVHPDSLHSNPSGDGGSLVHSPESQNHDRDARSQDAFQAEGDSVEQYEGNINIEGESVIAGDDRITKNGKHAAVPTSGHSKPQTSDGSSKNDSEVRTRTQGGGSPFADRNDEGGGVLPSAGMASGTIDQLESEEDALLSQLDAELDEGSRDHPVLDVANGLTKEAVIEGLVDYQKIKTELHHMKERHKRKSTDLERLREENEGLREQMTEGKQRIATQDAHIKESENNLRSQQFRNKELEVVIEQHKEDLDKSREKLRAHDAAAKKAISQLQQELVARVNQVKAMYDEAMKEKENMVLKYAKSEKEVLDLKKSKETMERKYKEGQTIVESSNTQTKQMRAEISKVKDLAATKEAKRGDLHREIDQLKEEETENINLQKEIDQLKEEVKSQDIKVKWAQNKLKSELDLHKETKLKLSKTEQKLAEAKEETETIRKNCQEMIKQYQESEEVKSNSLGIQLKKTEEELQIKEQETTDQLEVHNARLKELSSLKQAHNDATAELDSLRVKVKCLEDERIQQEEFLSQFKVLLNNQKDANRSLSRELEEAKSYQVQLTESEEKAQQLEERLGHIKEDGKDLEASLEASREKESELLQFTEKITSKNAELHAEIGQLQSKVEVLTEENKSLQSQLEEICGKHSQLTTDLQREKEYREREVLILTTRLNEKSRNEDNLSLKLEEAKDEAKTMKRRHAANTKDLTRQLQQAKKRLESMNKESQQGGIRENNSMGSRTSSSGSLEMAGAPGQSTPNSGRGSISGPTSETSPGSQSPQVTISSGNNDFPGIDKGMLVERIIRLQRLQQKYKEKIEFLQEHNRSLVEMIQKKNKIIQGYVMREESGALSTAASDIHKAQMARQSGIMASLYRSHASDPRMTLDLSLEINQKLQAVLEDTLLKNITLKENIDTLGREIARLSEDLFNTKERLKSRGK